MKSFVSEFVNTQLFEGLSQLYEKVRKNTKNDDKNDDENWNLIMLIRQCISIYEEEDGIKKIYHMLYPTEWKLKDVSLPVVDTMLSDEYDD